MYFYLLSLYCFFKDRVHEQVLNLEPDIFILNQKKTFLNFLLGLWRPDPAVYPLLSLPGIVQPERNIGIRTFFFKCPDRSALRMPADNNILNLKVLEGIFKDRCKIPVVNWYDVADITLDEQLSCL